MVTVRNSKSVSRLAFRGARAIYSIIRMLTVTANVIDHQQLQSNNEAEGLWPPHERRVLTRQSITSQERHDSLRLLLEQRSP